MSRIAPWSEKRKEVRALLRPFARPTFRQALPRVALDLALFVVCSAAIVLADNAIWKLVASIVLGVTISRMFVLGHDACHNSLTPSRRLNAWLGRILFLPTMSCASLWIAGHNVGHHGFAGFRGRDPAWVPLSPEQYKALPHGRRWLYRVYRSWWGAGIYYGVDIWWRQQYFPRGKIRAVFLWDSWLVTAFMAVQIAAYVGAAYVTGQSIALILLLGIALPFALWLYMAAFVFYVHHTDETARWYDDEHEWQTAQPNLDGTHGTQLPFRFDLLLHHAMEHTAHHVNAGIPSYRLAAAQRALQQRWPDEVPSRPITLRRYLAITRTCQLYDGRKHQWVSFATVDFPSIQIAPAGAAGNLSTGSTT